MKPAEALILFDIDGTLVRRAGPHHGEALVKAIRKITGVETSLDEVPVAGMLDIAILHEMMARAGLSRTAIRSALPGITASAERIYARSCPDLQEKICPGVHALLRRLQKRRLLTGLVTGNLTRIGWKKMERAGLRPYFRFGAFAELAKDRAGLVRLARREALRNGWIARGTPITLIGDHPNDVQAAKANGVRSIAVATGVVSREELAKHSPDILLPDLRSLRMEMLL